jgi:hypothetical protein
LAVFPPTIFETFEASAGALDTYLAKNCLRCAGEKNCPWNSATACEVPVLGFTVTPPTEYVS